LLARPRSPAGPGCATRSTKYGRLRHPLRRSEKGAAPTARSFYDTPAWQEARREALIRDRYRCVVCGLDVSGPGAARVDHIKPVRTHPQLALSLANLRTLCPAHDNQGHREKRLRSAAGREEKFVITGCDANGMPLDPGASLERLICGP
jgi:hypothetical protein